MSIENKDKEQKDNESYSKNFARIPNMLFASYKYLSKEEKFLYCTLKSIYWDAKPRFVSLRELSDATGYSRSALGKMLPRLHLCALINAEIKREKDKYGNEVGNPKYYITILDIWELNRENTIPVHQKDKN
jgi:predicted transcriptional regulator